MLHPIFQSRIERPDAPAVIDCRRSVSYHELAEHAERIIDKCGSLAGCRVGISCRSMVHHIASLIALDAVGADSFLLDARLSEEDRSDLSESLGLSACITDNASGNDISILHLSEEVTGSGESSVVILTSGTTGRPKAVRHTWESLLRPVRKQLSSGGGRWLLSYAPHLYAGVQVMLQAMVTGGAIVVAEPSDSPEETVRLLATSRVEYVSATPSYWRRWIASVPRDLLAAVPLKQITLGGEVVPAGLLEQLATLFPKARLTQIYATTELGRCFSVRDGKEGFPASYLEDSPEPGVDLKVDEGMLHVRSQNSMTGYESKGSVAHEATQWIATGDLVEQRGDRFYFVGRKSELINVGGFKVRPLDVEKVLRQVAGVAGVRVYSQPSSLVGELVACQIVPKAGVDVGDLRERIGRSALEILAPAERPRSIEFVQQIELTSSGKVSRRE